MKKPTSIVLRIWAAISAVALLSILSVGATVREAFTRAFGFYLQHQGMMPPGPRGGMRLMMMGAAEREFLASVDRAILTAGALAVGASFIVAYWVARRLARPLSTMTVGASAIADGALDHRVNVEGPAEVARLAEAFNEMAASLERAEQIRRRMVADIAHELRNPIAALRAQVEGLAEGVLEQSESRFRTLISDTEHLSRLVDDLQELSLIESGALKYEMVELDVGGLAKREAERAAVLAGERTRVHAECSDADTHLVVADERRISQVLRNLLSNALRHTMDGEVVVSCRTSKGEVLVRVEDTGEGIPPEALPFVFERFYRADDSRSVSSGGAGLGLAVAKRIIEDHGGRVFAAAAPSGGAVVGFALPKA